MTNFTDFVVRGSLLNPLNIMLFSTDLEQIDEGTRYCIDAQVDGTDPLGRKGAILAESAQENDVAKAFNDGGLASIDVHVSNGSSFSMQRWATGQGGFWDTQQWLVGDFNGDGKDDLAKAFTDAGLASIDVHTVI